MLKIKEFIFNKEQINYMRYDEVTKRLKVELLDGKIFHIRLTEKEYNSI